MRPKLKLLLIVIVFTFSFIRADAADEQSHRAAVERMLKATRAERLYESGLLSGFDAGVGLSSDRLAELPEEQQEKIKKALVKVKARVVELAGWEKIKAEMVALHMKHFTEKEAQEVTKLMETPTGKLLVEKQLAILPDSIKIGQGVAQRMMPEVVKTMEAEMKE